MWPSGVAQKFGFASCGRNVGAAEGVNVLTEQSRGDGSWEYAITCIEYTEFSKLGIADVPVSSGRYVVDCNSDGMFTSGLNKDAFTIQGE